MGRRLGLFVLVLALLPQSARPDGIMLPRQALWQRERERALLNEPLQKVALLYAGGRERLIISPSYEGPPGDFAWVVPVPTRPQIQILKGALFHELARIVEPAPPPGSARFRSKAVTEGVAAARPVVVLERETVGAYDVSVLSATDGGALQAWLGRNGYALPPSARRALAGYVRDGWTFVACRIQTPGSARGLQTGTLAPLSLTFPTPTLVYPMRLSSVNPLPFQLLLYLLRPQRAAVPQPEAWPGVAPPRTEPVPVTESSLSAPTLAGLGLPSLTVHWMRTTITPRDCTRDYVWRVAPPGDAHPNKSRKR